MILFSPSANSRLAKLRVNPEQADFQVVAPPSKPMKLPAFEAPIPEACAVKCRNWKLKQRKEKPRKQKRAAEGPLDEDELSDNHFVPDPRNDPHFNPPNPLGLQD